MTHPVIETPRLILRFPQIEDELLCNAFLASDRARFVGGPVGRGRAWRAFAHLVGQWEMRGYGMFTSTLRTTGHPVGMCGLFHPGEMEEPEISWSIWDAEFEGRGLAREAALAVRDFAYNTLGWSTVTSNIDAENARSVALAERLGCTIDRSYTEEDADGTDVLVHLYRHPSAVELAREGGMEAYS